MSFSQSTLRGRMLLVTFALAALVPLLFSPARADAAPADAFFSEYIEGSSNNKALEIVNGTGAAIDLAAGGYSVQMCFNGNPTCTLTIGLTGTVAAGDVYVLAQSAASPVILAQADQTNGAGWYNGDDAVLLRRAGTVIDSIGQQGFDPGTEWGSGLTSTADNTLRRKGTIQAGDSNPLDSFDPALEWDGFATDTFDGLGSHTIVEGDLPPSVVSTTPANDATVVPLDTNVTVTFSEDVSVSGSWFTISCTSSGVHTAAASGGPRTFTLDPDVGFADGEACTVRIAASQVADVDADDPPDTMAADFSFSFTTPVEIHDLQGASHISPLVGRQVAGVAGIVTGTLGNGFYLQDPTPDANAATSEGIFVFTSSAPAVDVGDELRVAGRVAEFRPGGATGTNLTTTELTSPSVIVLSSGNTLPAATVVGNGGRVPPSVVIEDDASGSVETSGVFDPDEDGIDFHESLEGMRAQVNDAVAVGPTNDFGEIPVVGDAGANAGLRTARGGVVISPDDFNPERIILDDTLFRHGASVDVGDRFPGAVTAVVDYSFGNFKFNVTGPLAPVSGGLEKETTAAPRDQEIAFATFNVENLDPGDGPAFAELAGLIVSNLQAPDLIGIEEVQDNDGQTDSGTTDASVTWEMLVAAIQVAGGPLYEYRQIDPLDNEDGGAPGGNIRVGFLFRTDRGLSFVDRPGGDATTPTTVIDHPSGPRLSISPGRIEPDSPAFVDTRKSLVGEFRARGRTIFAIVNHFSSKGGDDPLFGRFQPPVRHTEVARHQQAQVVNDFVDELLAADPNANVVVLGDINDFEFSETVDLLKGGVLVNLMDSLPKEERYSYVFEGNSQVLDQTLVSGNLARFPFTYDVVHVNSEFADQSSDHEPQVARFDLTGRPVP
jgi:predicted extracellular nuclease